PHRGSRWHVAEQPSPLVVLPSSHVSPTSTIPFPHTSNWQAAEQPSPPTVLPSSHCSPLPTTPSPHVASAERQLALSAVARMRALTTSPNTRSMFERPPARRWQ